MKKVILGALALLAVVSLTACGNKNEVEPSSGNIIDETTPVVTEIEENEEIEETVDVPKSEQTGTAGSNIPLKDNYAEAEYQIQVALQYKFAEIYGDSVFDARIYVEKIYSVEDEEAVDALKEMNLGMDEVAFEVRYELKPSEGADVNLLTVPDGEYDKESGWVKDIKRVGVLRPVDSGDQKYEITDFGTSW